MSPELRSGEPEKVGMSSSRVNHIVKLAKGWVDQGITPALVILVARKGVKVVHEAFGRLTPDDDAPPVKLDTIFPMASLSKPITATLAMILVEDGLLGLNRPVVEYIPEFVGEGKDRVMVHHLLTHTSGLRDEDLNMYVEKKRGTVDIPLPDKKQHPAINELLFLIYDAPLWKPPGKEMSYTGYNYGLLGEIIRRITGRALEDFARERLFDPLGMKDTYYVVPESLEHRVVKRSETEPDAGLNSLQHHEAPWARGGVYSTTMDMAVFGQMFLNQGTYGEVRILSRPSVVAMTRNQAPGIVSVYGDEFFREASYGFGWSVVHDLGNCLAYSEPLQSLESFSHGGAGGVFLWVDPPHEIVGAYFSVFSYNGIPSDRSLPDLYYLMGRMDLFINAVTAAIRDI